MSIEELIWLCSMSLVFNFSEYKCLQRYFPRSLLAFWEELVYGIPKIGCFRNFKDQIIEFAKKF